GVRGRLAGGAAAILELPQGRRRRHHRRHAVPLALRARQPVRWRQARDVRGRHAHPGARRRERQALRGNGRRRRVCHLRARRRRDRPDQQLVVHARAPRRPRNLPRRRDAGIGRRRPYRLLPATARGDAEARVESRRAADDRLPRHLAEDAGEPRVRQCVQGRVGAVPAPCRRGRPVSLEPAGGRQRRAARRAGDAQLDRATHARRTAARGVTATMRTLDLPDATGQLTRYALRGNVAPHAASMRPRWNRVAFAAAHVVSDPLANVDPWLATAIDWDATLAYRRYLWEQGFGVAEAMDTAQ